MKKTYETPVAEKVEFCYEDQIVASGATEVTNIVRCSWHDDAVAGGLSYCDKLPFSEGEE